MKFKTIVIDPPWIHKGPGWLGGAEKEYSRLSVDEIAKLPITSLLEENSHLWLWTTEEHLPQAYKLVKVWGVKKKALFPWVKTTRDERGLAWPAGYYGRVVTEYLLFTMRGRLPVPNSERQIRRIIFAPQGKTHSEKPEKAYELIERWSPLQRLELFAREEREGWTVWGNEVEDSLGIGFNPNEWGR